MANSRPNFLKNMHCFVICYTFIIPTHNTYIIFLLSPDCLYEFAGVSGGAPLQTYSLSAIDENLLSDLLVNKVWLLLAKLKVLLVMSRNENY